MDPSRSFLHACLAGLIPQRTKRYEIGGYWIDIHFESESLYRYFGMAITHLEKEEKTRADFQIFVRDQKVLPRPFWSWEDIDNQGNLVSNGNVWINYEHWNGILRVFDPEDHKAIFWVRDLATIPIWHRSFPFRTILTRLFEQTPLQPVHSSAIAWQGKAVLLAGASGSGKSSTALASLLHGLDFLGDDFNLVHTEEFTLHSLFSIAKLEKRQLDVFPTLRSFPRVGDEEKDQIEVARHFSDQVVRSAKLKAVLFPRISRLKSTSIIPIDAREALQQISRSTLELLQGNRMVHFHKLGKVCRKLPCYQLALSEDYSEIVNTLRRFLEDEE